MSRPPVARRRCMFCHKETLFAIIIGESDQDRDRRPMFHETWCRLYTPPKESS